MDPSSKAPPVPNLGARETIQRFHERHAGISSHIFTHMRGSDGRTSYDRVVDEVLGGSIAPRVLDLGCGDGTLLYQIAQRDSSVVLAGIDFSPFELDLARSKVPTATLRLGDLHESLPFADGAFDAVISHLVLMLLGNLDAILSSVARVLRPGGRFIFIVDALNREANAYADMLRAALPQAGVATGPLRFDTFSDPRLHDDVRLREMFDAHDLALRSSEPFTITGPADEAFCVDLILASYPLGVADEHVRSIAAQRTREWFSREARGIDTPLQLYVAERR